MRHHLLYSFMLLLLLASCRKEQALLSPEEQAKRDSVALHVGVVPVMDCLPIYYAQKVGLFDSAGLDVRLREYLSQMDCDTAIERNRVELAYGDMARVLLMQGDPRIVAGLRGRMALVTARTKRIRQLKHLNERMVGIDRLSATDYWSDELMRLAGLEQTAIYRPQVNDVQLRTSMLTEQLLDAALLPEPYATQATRSGNRQLFCTNDSSPSFACLVVPAATLTDTLRTGQIRRFFAAYNRAVEVLNSEELDTDSLRSILRGPYALAGDVADSLRLPRFLPAAMPKAKDADIAVQWLKSRERIVRASRRDSLFCNRFVK